MLLKELEEGIIYRCKLSENKVLVVMTEPQTLEGDNPTIVPGKKAGKSVIKLDNGDYKYAYSELHDGQLEELN